MTSKEESLGPLRILKKRLKEMADKLHIELNNVAFMVDEDDSGSPEPDMVQVVFILTPEALKTADELEQARIDSEFERMMAGDATIDKAQDIKNDDLDLWED